MAWDRLRATASGNEVEAAHLAVGGIESDPAGARHEHFRPGMGDARLPLQGGIEDIAGAAPHTEAQRPGRLHEQHGEVAAGAADQIERAGRRLGAFILARLIAGGGRNAGIQVFEQRQRVGGIAAHKARRPGRQPAA